MVDGYKETAAIPIGNLHIILLHALDRDFLQTAKYTNPVVIMHNIIPDMQIGKAFDCRAVFPALLSFFLFLAAE